MKALILFAICSILLPAVSSYYISIDANEEQCFFDRLTAKSIFGVMFEVAEGGFRDIDVKITGPDGRLIYDGVRETSGKYTFAAETDGVYTYCFGNKMSSMTPKEVMFTIDISVPNANQPKIPTADSEHDASMWILRRYYRILAESRKLTEMVDELSKVLKVIKNEQEYMEIRDRVHRSINENTNGRVVMWALFEAVVLIVMTFGQVFYLKRFFEVRTVV